MSDDHFQSEWKQEVEHDDRAFIPKKYRDQAALAMSQALSKAGLPHVVITDMDRLQGAAIEAEAFLEQGNLTEAERSLREALKEQ